MLLHYFKKKENNQKNSHDIVYLSLVDFVKNLYEKNEYSIKKEFNSSFEITTILLFFCFHIFKEDEYKAHKQAIFDLFINDLDFSFRNLGIGDMSIGKYVKKYVKKIYYRFKILEKIIEQNNNIEDFENYIIDLNILDNHNDSKKFSHFMYKILTKTINLQKNKNFDDFRFINLIK